MMSNLLFDGGGATGRLVAGFCVAVSCFMAHAQEAGASGPFWPGTQTRYYPGIYPKLFFRHTALNPENLQKAWNEWFAGREADYKETFQGVDATHLGFAVMIDPTMFFSEKWNASDSAPFDWKHACGRIAEAQKPDAKAQGEPVYDWRRWDDILSAEFLARGQGRLILRMQQSYIRFIPPWMTAEGYAMKTERWFFCQMQDSAVMYMWQDILAAFAARHRDDTRIAAVLFDELYPRMWEPHVDLCGNVHELDDPQAVNSAQMELMKAYLEQDPGMLCAPINWYSGIEPIREKWEKGFGNGSPGADDLPGVQGHYRQDPRFFQNGLGKDAESGIDDIRNSFMNDYLIQYYGVKKLAPVFAGTEGTGWYLDTHDYRTGNENPWNAAPWPQEGDSLPNDDGNPMPSARFWAWYYSGAPKAKGGAADSRLGQEGPDPSGVVPANFYCPDVVEGNRFGHSVERWLAAFRTFGPKGTQAMFAHPDGYLEQFEKMSRKKQNGSNE